MPSVQPTSAWGFPNAATPPGSTVYYSLRFAPAARRHDLALLHAWRHETRRALNETSDPGIAAARLSWWREEFERTVRHEATHPLARLLAEACQRHQLPPEPFREMLASAETSLSGETPEDFRALAAHAESDLGALFELITSCFGHTDPHALRTARRLGAYSGLIAGLRDAGWLLRRGRYDFLAADRLNATGFSIQTLARSEQRDVARHLLAETALDILSLRAQIGTAIKGLPVTLRIQARLSALLLEELAASGFRVLDQRISLTPIRKFWYAWLESRR